MTWTARARTRGRGEGILIRCCLCRPKMHTCKDELQRQSFTNTHAYPEAKNMKEIKGTPPLERTGKETIDDARRCCLRSARTSYRLTQNLLPLFRRSGSFHGHIPSILEPWVVFRLHPHVPWVWVCPRQPAPASFCFLAIPVRDLGSRHPSRNGDLRSHRDKLRQAFLLHPFPRRGSSIPAAPDACCQLVD